LVLKMHAHIRLWEESGDERALFLRCYSLMTENMLAAIGRKEFDDPAWVERLLHRFAEYYFIALEAYENEPESSPAVWQLAHKAAGEAQASALQKMLLGVSAHINYDLVFALADLLRMEWEAHSHEQRASRYADHCRVNDIIGGTVDAVQDQVLEPAMPLMEMMDRLMGPVDELLISRLISGWRETVWQNAARLLAAGDAQEQTHFIRQLEESALATAGMIYR
jgi:hypothetical protein